MSQTNDLLLKAVREDTYNVTPTTPAMWQFRVLRETLRGTFTKTPSEEIRGSRLMLKPEPTAKDVDGGFEAYFSYGLCYKFLDSLFMSPYVEQVSRYNAGVADSVITGITASSDTYAFTTGTAFVVGHLVYMSGFTAAANNGLKTVLTGGATSLVVADGTIDEAVPPAQARIRVVGVEGATADLTLSAAGTPAAGQATIGSTVMDFTAMGFAADMWIRIGDKTAAVAFRSLTDDVVTGQAHPNNAYVRIVSVAANAMVVDHLPSGWAADAGTGKTLRIFLPTFVTIGSTNLGTTIEKDNSGLGSRKYLQLTGCIPDQVDIVTRFRDRARFNVTKMFGIDHALPATSLDDTPDDPVNDDPAISGTHIMRAGLSSDFFTSQLYCPELTWRINNNLRGIENIERVLTFVGARAGDAVFNVSGRLYFNSWSLVDTYRANTPIDVYQAVERDNHAVVLDIRQAVISNADVPAPGRNQDWFVEFEAMGYAPTGSRQAVACLFPYVQ